MDSPRFDLYDGRRGQERNSNSPEVWRTAAKFHRRALLAQGYFVSTVGLDEDMVRAYIRNQEEEDERYDQMSRVMK